MARKGFSRILKGRSAAPTYRSPMTYAQRVHWYLNQASRKLRLAVEEVPSGPEYPEAFMLAQAVTKGGSHAGNGAYDPADTGWAGYDYYYANLPGFEWLRFAEAASGNPTLALETQTIEWFDKDRVYRILATVQSQPADDADLKIEFLDESNTLLGVINCEKNGNYKIRLGYGPSVAALTYALTSGSYPAANGDLYFDSSTVYFSNLAGANYVQDWSMGINTAAISKLRISTYAKCGNSGFASTVTAWLHVREADYVLP